MKSESGHPLFSAMSAAVPLRIEALKQKGGPSDEDLKRAREVGVLLAEKGDVFLFGGGKKGEAADLFNKVAEAVAVLAFCPGGVKLFGSTFEANPKGEVKKP